MAIWTPTVKPEKADLIKDLKKMADSIDTEKVQKETGKRLITNEEATKLAGLENYDDSELIKLIDSQNIDIKYLEKQVEQLLKDHKPIPFNGVSNHLQDTGDFPMPISINGGIEQEQSEASKNKCPDTIEYWESGDYSSSNGSKVEYPSRIRLKELLKLESLVDYYINTGHPNYVGVVRTFKRDKAFSRNLSVINATTPMQLNEDEAYIGMSFAKANSSDTSDTFEILKAMFESGELKPFIYLASETDKSYVPFSPNMPSIEFPSEVKGIGSEEDINILDIRNAYEVTKAGVTLTVDKEKQEITLNGECTADNTTFSLNTTLQCKAGDYTRGFKYVDGSVNIPSGKTSSINLQSSDWQGFVTNLANNDVFANQTISSDLNISYTVIRCDSGCVYNNFKIKPFLVSGSNNRYTPYGYCRYDNVVENKNFFNLTVEETDKVRYGITVNNSKNKIKYNGTVSIGSAINPNGWDFATLKYELPAGDYIYTLKKISGSYNMNGASDEIILRDENKQPLRNCGSFAYMIENNHQVKFTNPKTQTVYFQHYCNAGITFNNFEFEIQIEKDNGSATEIVEHQEQLLPIDIPTGQVWYSGKPYKENGKWYRDVEFVKEYVTEAMLELATFRAKTFRIAVSRITNNLADALNAYCNIAKQNSFNNRTKLDTDNLTNVYIDTERTNIVVLRNTNFEDISSFAEYLANNEVYIVYRLATPTVEEITDTTLISQYEAMQKAHSYYEVTNINSYKSSEDVADLVLSGNALMSNDLRMSKLESALLNVSAEV